MEHTQEAPGRVVALGHGSAVALGVGALALVGWTAARHSAVSVALVCASLALAGASAWSCQVLLGKHATALFAAIACALGWFAEQMGSTHGWFFGHYTYTDVLGPRLADVPIVIPLMWFGLCHIGFVMASLLLWRKPADDTPDAWRMAGVTLLGAMLVTAFDLGADPYFVYQLQAWVMEKKDGGWFGETLVGFAGWMVVSATILALFQRLGRPRLQDAAPRALHRAALVPLLVYGGFLVFQVCFSHLHELRIVALFAMGIPLLVALVAWHQWRTEVGA